MTTIPRCPSHGVELVYIGPRPGGFQWHCRIQHCGHGNLYPTPPPAYVRPQTPMLQPILYAPPGLPVELSDRARNWIFEQGYPAPSIEAKPLVPREGSLLVIPSLALIASRSRFLDLVIQTASAGGKLVVIEPFIDLRGDTPASIGQNSALFPLSQLPDKAPLPDGSERKPASVPFVEQAGTQERPEAPNEGEDSAKPAAKPKTAQKATEYTPEQVEKAWAHTATHGSGRLVDFAKSVGMAPREAAKLLAMVQTSKKD